MATFRYQTLTEVSFTTSYALTINSVANNAGAISSAYNNTTSRFPFGQIEVGLSFASAPTDGTMVRVYAVYSIDGTNFSEGSSSVEPKVDLLWGFTLRNNATQRHVSPVVQLAPNQFKILFWNASGQTMNSTGNELSLALFGWEAI